MTADGNWPTFGVEYVFAGKTWVMHLPARDHDEAEARARAIGSTGRVLGELDGGGDGTGG